MGAVFAEKFNRSVRDLPEKPVFEEGDANWIDVIPIITKQLIIKTQIFTKLTAIPASLGKIEVFVLQLLLVDLQNVGPKNKIGNLGRTTILEKTFSKAATTEWSD